MAATSQEWALPLEAKTREEVQIKMLLGNLGK